MDDFPPVACHDYSDPSQSAQRFRKRPIEIEAIRWQRDNLEAVLAFIGLERVKGAVGGILYIETLEGTMQATPGCWVVKGIKGEVYPVQPEIFDRTYEPA